MGISLVSLYWGAIYYGGRCSVVYNSILSSSLLFSHNLELWEEDDKKDDDVESNNSSQKDILASSNKPVFWQRGETWMFKYSWHTTKKNHIDSQKIVVFL